MGRTILAVIVGYVVLFLVVMATFSIAYIALGADRSFQPGSYTPSGLWVVLSLVLGFIAAVLGGWACVAIAKRASAGKVLAILVVVIGLAMSIPALRAPSAAPGERTGSVSNFEAMQKAKQPKWVTFVNPFLGAAGVLVGARRRITV